MADNNQIGSLNNMGFSNQNQSLGYPGNMTNNQNGRNPYINQYSGVPLNNPMYGNNYGMNQFQSAQQQQSQVNNSSNQYLKCRPVSSREEAKAAQIDLDGSLWVFTDVGNERIYTKQINPNGTASFVTYQRVEDETPQYLASNEYVTKEEFNKVIQALMTAMQPTNSTESHISDGTQDKQSALMEL